MSYEHVIVLGDFNVVLSDIETAYDLTKLVNESTFSVAERERFKKMLKSTEVEDVWDSIHVG